VPRTTTRTMSRTSVDRKRLRFVSCSGVRLEGEGHAVRSGIGGGGGPDGSFEWNVQFGRWRFRKSWTCTKWRRSTSTRAGPGHFASTAGKDIHVVFFFSLFCTHLQYYNIHRR
jgi:hypothetical protein